MALIYECDRCGARSTDRMPRVAIAMSNGGGDFSLPQDLLPKAPMLCKACTLVVVERLTEQLPRSA